MYCHASRRLEAYVEQTCTCAHNEACLVECCDTGSVVVWLSVGEVCTGVRQVHHSRQIRVPRSEFERRDLVDNCFWRQLRCEIRSNRPRVRHNDRKRQLLVCISWYGGDVGPQLAGAVGGVICEKVSSSRLVEEVIGNHSRPRIRQAGVSGMWR